MESDWVKVRLYVYWKSYSKRFVSRRVESSYSHEVFHVLNLLTQHNFIWLLIISILQAIKEPLIHYTITDVKVLPAACKAFPVNSSSLLAALHSAPAAMLPMSGILTFLPAAAAFFLLQVISQRCQRRRGCLYFQQLGLRPFLYLLR